MANNEGEQRQPRTSSELNTYTNRNFGSLMARVKGITRCQDDSIVADAVQLALLTAFEQLGKEQTETFMSWLVTTACNRLRKYFKKETHHNALLENESVMWAMGSPASDRSTGCAGNDHADLIDKAINSLSNQDQEIIRSAIAGEGLGKLAMRLGKRKNAASVALHRARTRLMAKLPVGMWKVNRHKWKMKPKRHKRRMKAK